ncbi:MAG: DsrE family protein [Candidatus Methanoperedenaceae archaeon]|nr:DsrE family protein [Candidatus Methanoperedenaceae archaeon]
MVLSDNMTGKQLTIVSINGPYRDEAVFTMMRLAHAAKEKGITVNFFNYLDATIVAHKDQAPKEFPTVETIFGNIVKKGLKNPKADAVACIKCTDARGVTNYQTEGVIIGGLFDLGEWTAEADKTILLG